VVTGLLVAGVFLPVFAMLIVRSCSDFYISGSGHTHLITVDQLFSEFPIPVNAAPTKPVVKVSKRESASVSQFLSLPITREALLGFYQNKLTGQGWATWTNGAYDGAAAIASYCKGNYVANVAVDSEQRYFVISINWNILKLVPACAATLPNEAWENEKRALQ